MTPKKKAAATKGAAPQTPTQRWLSAVPDLPHQSHVCSTASGSCSLYGSINASTSSPRTSTVACIGPAPKRSPERSRRAPAEAPQVPRIICPLPEVQQQVGPDDDH